VSGALTTLTLNREQVATLLALVGVGDLTVQLDLQPPSEDDARLLRGYVETVRAGVSLERPMTELRKWLTAQERGKR
jgi:hypothetical protein